jgi:Zn-dependent peptidase ImmA (M78 family)/transcriptional regulator with XRE-family HTH domain
MFNGNELRLARQYHGYTLNDLANLIEKSRQYVHQLETGRTEPTLQTIELLAEKLDVMPEFFCSSGQTYFADEQFHFRKNVTAKIAFRQTVKARGEFFERVVKFIDKNLTLPPVNFPSYEAETNEDVERAAENARRHWDLGTGPISNMVRVVENAGAVVTSFDGVSATVDALSITAKRPIIIRNDAKQSPYRLRFDLGHETGHLIMHEGHVTGDRLTESQANRFASAFLMPRTTFAKDFLLAGKSGSRISWQGLSEIKLKWKVTKAAILYRAKDLNLIDDNQYVSAVIGLKKRGEGIIESEDSSLDKEKFELINNAIMGLNNYSNINSEEMAKFFFVNKRFLSVILEMPKTAPKLRLVSW